MSAKSWKEEFYPIPASKTKKKDALAHSLQKWRGLTDSAVHKHGLAEPPIAVNGDTCALCNFYFNAVTPTRCIKNGYACPLFEARGVRCDMGDFAPFTEYEEGDPIPMIKLLRKLKNKQDKAGISK